MPPKSEGFLKWECLLLDMGVQFVLSVVVLEAIFRASERVMCEVNIGRTNRHLWRARCSY